MEILKVVWSTESSTLRDPNASLDQTNNNIHFIPSNDTNITAIYVKKSYTLDTPLLGSGGTVTGKGQYLFESIVDLTASPSEHFSFKQWMGNTSQLNYPITESMNRVTIPDSNISLSPIFVPKLYNVNTFPDNNGSIQTSSEFQGVFSQNLSEYNASSEITINAFPDNTDDHMLGYIYWENSHGQSGYWYSPTLTIPFLDGNYSFGLTLYQKRSRLFTIRYSTFFGICW